VDSQRRISGLPRFCLRNLRAQRTVYSAILANLILTSLILTGCSPTPTTPPDGPLNSRYQDSQPALSGDGRYLAMITDRRGIQELALYNLAQQRFEALPRLSQPQSALESPSLSRSARYIVYLTSDRGRPDIGLYDRSTQRSESLTLGYPSPIRNPSISPDGRYVSFETLRSGQWDIEVLDRGGQVSLDLPSGSPNVQPKP
jgi:Tol biopolymer transport system component